MMHGIVTSFSTFSQVLKLFAQADMMNLSKFENKNYKVKYNDFFSLLTKSRENNYLRIMGDKIFSIRGRAFKFSNGNPNSQCFPYEEVSVKLKNGKTFQIKDNQLADSLTHSTVNGYEPLVSMMKDFQDRFHGLQNWNEKDITITCGSQAGLYLTVETFISAGDPVLTQIPLYTGFLTILEPLKVEFLEADRDEDGICPKKLENMLFERKKRNLPMPKVFYINPTGTNPTGDITTTEKKKEIYRIACEYNFLILEDDPYYLLTFNSKNPVVSFLSFDTQNRVIRFDSFSKTIGAGYRLGYVTAAKEVVNQLNILKEVSNVCPPFCQTVVYETLNSMGFDGFMNHVTLIKHFYNKNCEAMIKSLNQNMREIATWVVPEAAMFVWLTIKGIDHIPSSFVDKCLQKLVFIVPGFAFYPNNRRSPSIRLAFSLLNEMEIDEGIKILAGLIKEELLITKRGPP